MALGPLKQFGITKIVATTLGETGGDLLAQTMHVGYLVSTVIFFALFLIAVVFQLKARRFHPAIFWTVIALTSTAGTPLDVTASMPSCHDR